MRHRIVAAFCLVAVVGCSPPEPPPAKVLKAPPPGPPATGFNKVPVTGLADHVPDPAEFDKILRRDLEAALKAKSTGSVSLEFEILDKTPSRSGNSFPKFYLWVIVKRDGEVSEEGLVTVSAEFKKRFQVGEIESLDDMKADPKIENGLPPRIAKAVEAKRA